jgi:hypothetical protein
MYLDGIYEAKAVNWLDLGSKFIAALVFSPHKFTNTYCYAAHQSKAGTQLLNECPVMACFDVRRLLNFLCCKFNQWTVTDHPFVSYLLVSTSRYLQSLIGHFVLPSTSSWFYRLHPQLYLPFVFIIHWFLWPDKLQDIIAWTACSPYCKEMCDFIHTISEGHSVGLMVLWKFRAVNLIMRSRSLLMLPLHPPSTCYCWKWNQVDHLALSVHVQWSYLDLTYLMLSHKGCARDQFLWPVVF